MNYMNEINEAYTDGYNAALEGLFDAERDKIDDMYQEGLITAEEHKKRLRKLKRKKALVGLAGLGLAGAGGYALYKSGSAKKDDVRDTDYYNIKMNDDGTVSPKKKEEEKKESTADMVDRLTGKKSNKSNLDSGSKNSKKTKNDNLSNSDSNATGKRKPSAEMYKEYPITKDINEIEEYFKSGNKNLQDFYKRLQNKQPEWYNDTIQKSQASLDKLNELYQKGEYSDKNYLISKQRYLYEIKLAKHYQDNGKKIKNNEKSLKQLKDRLKKLKTDADTELLLSGKKINVNEIKELEEKIKNFDGSAAFYGDDWDEDTFAFEEWKFEIAKDCPIALEVFFDGSKEKYNYLYDIYTSGKYTTDAYVQECMSILSSYYNADDIAIENIVSNILDFDDNDDIDII